MDKGVHRGIKKLELKKETLRALQDSELSHVAGGGTTDTVIADPTTETRVATICDPPWVGFTWSCPTSLC